jgi:perosamine synthetase
MIQVFRPLIDYKKVLQQLEPVLKSGWIGLGPKVKEFEDKLSKFIGAKHFSALNSCTSALHLAVKALNLKKGSRILTTPLTFVSTNHAILYEDLEPVFCDVHPTTGIIDERLIEDAIKKYSIKALMVVHVGGYSAEMSAINQLGKKYGIPIIEDCAHAFGAKYENKKVGDTDNLCVWSFHAVKNLPMGDGGAISTNNDLLIKEFNKLRWLGIDKDTVSRSSSETSSKKFYNWDYNVELLGYKYHLNDILATLGIVGLDTIEENNARRRFIAEYYLNNIKNAIKPGYLSNRKSSYHFLPLFFEQREEVYKRLVAHEIYPGMHYKRNDQYNIYNNFIKINNCENAEWYQQHELTLPIHLELTDDDLKYIVDVINE